MDSPIPTILTNERTKAILRGIARQLFKDRNKFLDWDLRAEHHYETLNSADDFSDALVKQFEHELLMNQIGDTVQVELGFIRALTGAIDGETTYHAVQRMMQDCKEQLEQLETMYWKR